MEHKGRDKDGGNFFPLKSKFIFMYTAVMVTVILVIVLIIGLKTSSMLKEKSVGNCVQELNFVMERLDTLLSKIDNESVLLTTNLAKVQSTLTSEPNLQYQQYERFQEMSKFMMEFLVNHSGISSVTYYDRDGGVFYKGNYDTSVQQTSTMPKEIVAFNRSQSKTDWYVDMTKIPSGKSIVNFYFLKKSYSFNGELLGTFAVSISEKEISKIYSAPFYSEASFLLVNQEDIVCSAFLKERIGQNLFEHQKDKGSFLINGVSNASACDYGGYLYTFKECGKMGLQIVAVVSNNYVYRDSWMLVRSIAVISLFFMFVSYILFSRLTNHIIAPLNSVISKVHVISNGDYTTKINVESYDEIGILAVQINQMSENTLKLMNDIKFKEEQKRKYELSYWQIQMQPHFLYNTLETICGMIEVDNKKEAIELINDISRFYREVLNRGRVVITIEQELNITEYYLRIMQKRYCNRFQFQIDVDAEIFSRKIPKLSIQPLVENSIIHGIINSDRQGRIDILGWRENGKICLSVIDNGMGMEKTKLENLTGKVISEEWKGQSFGVSSIKKRLELYLGEGAEILICSQPDHGTRVDVIFPDEEAEKASNEERL